MDQDDLQRELIWRDGVPVSRRFEDPYFSLRDGLEETRHVFLKGNQLPARFVDGFHVAELGFGTGLNALATLEAWCSDGSFQFTSFEAYPISADDMEAALSRWPSLQVGALVDNWRNGAQRFQIGAMHLEVIVGDVQDTLKDWDRRADAWFLDGFAPARNEAMWTERVLAEVARHTNEGGTFATYTAASAVRQRLEEAGFTVRRLKGFGHKRHMSAGVYAAG